MLLVDVELFETSVEVISGVIPGVRGPVLVGVCPAVGQKNLSRVWPDIGKGIENVGQLLCWELLWLIVATVDGPVLYFINMFALLRCSRWRLTT